MWNWYRKRLYEIIVYLALKNYLMNKEPLESLKIVSWLRIWINRLWIALKLYHVFLYREKLYHDAVKWILLLNKDAYIAYFFFSYSTGILAPSICYKWNKLCQMNCLERLKWIVFICTLKTIFMQTFFYLFDPLHAIKLFEHKKIHAASIFLHLVHHRTVSSISVYL